MVGSPRYVALVGLLAVVAGVVVALVGVLRLGWIAEFLSTPIITGFLAGVAIIIIVRQLPDLLGLPPSTGSSLHRAGDVIGHLNQANAWTVGIGIGGFVVIAVAHRLDRRLPAAVVVLVGSTFLVAAADLPAHGVAVLGPVAHAAPSLGLSGLPWSAIGSVLPVAAVAALVVISQSAPTTRASADQGGYAVDVGRDFLGVGTGSVLAGLVGSFAVNASPPRTAAVASAGGRTQLTGLGAAAGMVVLVPTAGLLTDLPLAALAAVLIFIAIRIIHARELVAVFRFDLWEFGLAVATLLTVALIGVEQGVGVAVGLAILDRARLSARPRAHVMARNPDTTSWQPLEPGQHRTEIPGVLVVPFAAPLYYANAAHFRTQLDQALAHLPSRPQLLVLDVVGMHDIDYTGARALKDLLDELDRQRIVLAVTRPGSHLLTNLGRSGLLERVGTDHILASVNEAVRALGPDRSTS